MSREARGKLGDTGSCAEIGSGILTEATTPLFSSVRRDNGFVFSTCRGGEPGVL